MNLWSVIVSVVCVCVVEATEDCHPAQSLSDTMLDIKASIKATSKAHTELIVEKHVGSLDECNQACCDAAVSDGCNIAVISSGGNCTLYKCSPQEKCVTTSQAGQTLTFFDSRSQEETRSLQSTVSSSSAILEMSTSSPSTSLGSTSSFSSSPTSTSSTSAVTSTLSSVKTGETVTKTVTVSTSLDVTGKSTQTSLSTSVTSTTATATATTTTTTTTEVGTSTASMVTKETTQSNDKSNLSLNQSNTEKTNKTTNEEKVNSKQTNPQTSSMMTSTTTSISTSPTQSSSLTTSSLSSSPSTTAEEKQQYTTSEAVSMVSTNPPKDITANIQPYNQTEAINETLGNKLHHTNEVTIPTAHQMIPPPVKNMSAEQDNTSKSGKEGEQITNGTTNTLEPVLTTLEPTNTGSTTSSSQSGNVVSSKNPDDQEKTESTENTTASSGSHHFRLPHLKSPKDAAMSGALIAALSFGIVFFFSILVLVGKRCFDSWQRRHYSRMDYLINGMYN